MRKSCKNKSYIKFENKIIDAFVSLFDKKTNGRISVNDIMKKAGVGRATFYQHFKSIDDVYAGLAKRISKTACEIIIKNATLDMKNSKKVVQEWLKTIQKNLSFFRSLAYNKQLNNIVRFTTQNIFDSYSKLIKDNTFDNYAVKLNIISAVASIVNAIAYTARNEVNCSWDELAEWYTDLTKKIFLVPNKEN